MPISSQVPATVRAARTMWFTAIGAGLFETVLVLASGRAGGGAVVGVAVRVVVFAAAVLVVLRMCSGRRWARLALTVVLGFFGILSLTVAPFLWLMHGNSLTRVIQDSGPIDLLFGGSRVVHVVAVLGGCVLMFLPTANRYFRTSGSRPARDPAGPPISAAEPLGRASAG